jgi:hypothetical protein
MCRLALLNREGIKLMEEMFGLENFLEFLEKNMGGHGNGYALVKENKVIRTQKGVSLKNKTIAKVTNNQDPDWLVYHTRIASAGTVKDTNCHPYWNKNKSFVLAMNGTVSSYADIARSIDITDTELIFRNILDYKVPVDSILELSPKFIGVLNGKVFASNPNAYATGLEYIHLGEAIIIASTFPKSLSAIVESMDKQFWIEGDTIKKKSTYVVSGYSGYKGGYGYYGRSWDDSDIDVEEYLNRKYGNTFKEDKKKDESKEIVVIEPENIKDVKEVYNVREINENNYFDDDNQCFYKTNASGDIIEIY